jgi:branched-chain amino acid transport system permease protein
MVALLFSLSLPRGIWGWLDDRHALQLLPVGYRLTGITSLDGRRPETDQAS